MRGRSPGAALPGAAWDGRRSWRFGRSGWFTALLEAEVAQHQPLELRPGLRPRALARAHVREVLQDSGLLYGTPETREADASGTPEERLFLAVLRTLVQLALDLADIAGLGPERRVERMAVLFAAWIGDLELAEQLQQGLRKTGTAPPRGRRPGWSRRWRSGPSRWAATRSTGCSCTTARPTSTRSSSPTSPTPPGCASRSGCRRRGAGWRWRRGRRRCWWRCSPHSPAPSGLPPRRRGGPSSARWRRLGLPRPLALSLKVRVKRAFLERPDLDVLVRPVRSRPLRRFILQQTVLASLVEGRRSAAELAFLRALARALRIPPEGLPGDRGRGRRVLRPAPLHPRRLHRDRQRGQPRRRVGGRDAALAGRERAGAGASRPG